MKKGEVYEGVVEACDFPCKGSLTLEGRRVIIKDALEGQRIRFMITKKKSGKAEGRVIEVLEKSPIEDAALSCKYFGVCGGCTYGTMSYANQLRLKERMAKKLLDGVISYDYEWEGILPSPLEAEYRNKMEFTFGDECKGGPLALGLHKKGNFYDILHVSGCEIMAKEWSMILDYTQDFFRERKVPFYHRMSHEGILRNLVVRQSFHTDEFLINLITSTQWEQFGFGTGEGILREYTDGLLALTQRETFQKSIGGILHTENDTLGDVVKCDRMRCLYGRDYIIEEVMGLRFKISPFSFFQTNTKSCEVLYEKAREYILSGMTEVFSASETKTDGAGLAGDDDSQGGAGKIVFDLYSGTGTIAQMMAAAAKKVIGIEIVGEAVEAARENAAMNGLTNCEFIEGDVLKALDLVEEKPDLIILDPPRDGINPKALERIISFGVNEMVYISCKPTSLARDLVTLQANGYRVRKACAVDQFPRTGHVEVVCCLQRKDS